MACESYIKQNNSSDTIYRFNFINNNKIIQYETTIELLEVTKEIIKTIRIMFLINILNKEKINKLKDIYEVQKNNKKKLILEINAYKEGV